MSKEKKAKFYTCCGLVYSLLTEKCIECGKKLTKISTWYYNGNLEDCERLNE